MTTLCFTRVTAESCGIRPVQSYIEPGSLTRTVSLDVLLDGSPNPLAPTVREAIVAALSDIEQERFLAELGRAVAECSAIRRSAVAYLAARKSDLTIAERAFV